MEQESMPCAICGVNDDEGWPVQGEYGLEEHCCLMCFEKACAESWWVVVASGKNKE